MKPLASPVRNVNLKLMQGFVLVGHHRSFKRAAELSGCTQSAMSAQIRTLEKQLGTTLFHRTTRHVKLTDEGELLFKSAVRAIDDIGTSLSDIQKIIDRRTEHVSIACSPLFSMHVFADLIPVFGREYPKSTVSVREATTDDAIRMIAEQGFDFGIGSIVDAPTLQFEPLMREPIIALVPKAMRMKPGACLSLDQLSRLPLILLDESTALRQQLNAVASGKGVVLSARYEFSQGQTLVRMAEAGLGVAVLPRSIACQQRLKHAHVHSLSDEGLLRDHAVFLPKARQLSPAASQIVALLKRQAYPA